jgi:hypothetical protein
MLSTCGDSCKTVRTCIRGLYNGIAEVDHPDRQEIGQVEKILAWECSDPYSALILVTFPRHVGRTISESTWRNMVWAISFFCHHCALIFAQILTDRGAA